MYRQRIPQLLHKNFLFISLLSLVFVLLLFSSANAQNQNGELRELYERAVNAYSKQQFDQAALIYKEIIKAAPTFAPAYNGLALVNQAVAGDENKTIEYLKTAVSYDPKLGQSYDNLGRIYYARQDVDHAEEYFNKALEADPNITSAQICLAWINLLLRSKPVAALKYFKLALANSNDPKIYYGMGQAYFASNQRPEAMDMITKLHSLGEDELAERLEKSMRENSEVNAETSNPGGSTSSSKPVGFGPLSPTPDKPTGTQVHLRGKLSDY